MSNKNTLRIEMMGGCLTDHGFHIPITENEDTEFVAPRGKGVCRLQIEDRAPVYISTRFTAYEELHPDGKIRDNHGHFVFLDNDGDKLLARWESPRWPEENGVLYFASGTGKWKGAKGHLDKTLHVAPPLSEEEWIFFEGTGLIELAS